MSKKLGWETSETLEFSIPNPRACVRIPRPDNITDEQWETFVANVEILNNPPSWFQVGTKVYFIDWTDNPTQVLSIDEQNGSWIGEDVDGKHKYPLDEIYQYWRKWYDKLKK
jgi:hypothetical protein